MRLGQITGWDAINAEAQRQAREEKRKRREEYERQRRRAELDSAGFRPIGKPYESWGSE